MGKGVVKRQSLLQEVAKRTHLWEPLETKEVLENGKVKSSNQCIS
jgi:hypothetical protein